MRLCVRFSLWVAGNSPRCVSAVPSIPAPLPAPRTEHATCFIHKGTPPASPRRPPTMQMRTRLTHRTQFRPPTPWPPSFRLSIFAFRLSSSPQSAIDNRQSAMPRFHPRPSAAAQRTQFPPQPPFPTPPTRLRPSLHPPAASKRTQFRPPTPRPHPFRLSIFDFRLSTFPTSPIRNPKSAIGAGLLIRVPLRLHNEPISRPAQRSPPALLPCGGWGRRAAPPRPGPPASAGSGRAYSSSTSMGPTCQIFSQYSRIERSEENAPMRATFRIDMRVQASASRKACPTRSWHSM